MNSMKKKNPNPNPNMSSQVKKRLASRFLRSMKKLRSKGSRSHAIRAAAYASMASAVGPRKAWSRALLRDHKSKPMVLMSRTRTKRDDDDDDDDGLSDLSQLVPGGKEMDSCTLLNETAHYINCLAALVQIMTQILHYSPSSKH